AIKQNRTFDAVSFWHHVQLFAIGSSNDATKIEGSFSLTPPARSISSACATQHLYSLVTKSPVVAYPRQSHLSHLHDIGHSFAQLACINKRLITAFSLDSAGCIRWPGIAGIGEPGSYDILSCHSC